MDQKASDGRVSQNGFQFLRWFYRGRNTLFGTTRMERRRAEGTVHSQNVDSQNSHVFCTRFQYLNSNCERERPPRRSSRGSRGSCLSAGPALARLQHHPAAFPGTRIRVPTTCALARGGTQTSCLEGSSRRSSGCWNLEKQRRERVENVSDCIRHCLTLCRRVLGREQF